LSYKPDLSKQYSNFKTRQSFGNRLSQRASTDSPFVLANPFGTKKYPTPEDIEDALEERKEEGKFEFGEYWSYGEPKYITLPEGQTAIIPGELTLTYTEDDIQNMVKNLREALSLLKRASPEFYDVFTDDIKRIVIDVTDEKDPLTSGRKSKKDLDLMFISSEAVLHFAAKEIAGILSHEEFHALLQYLKRDTKEEEALAFKTESVILDKLHRKGMTDEQIRQNINEFYHDLPSILQKPSISEQISEKLGID